MRQRVAYPGILGSFSWGAARAAFPGAEVVGFPSFPEAAEAAQRDMDYAVLPIENSSAGAVSGTYDLLDQLKLRIVGEILRRVEHHLLGLPEARLEDIRRVTSHPQALAQCNVFLSGLKGVQLLPSANTAISAREAAQQGDPSLAAIASVEAAQAYGLKVLASGIQNTQVNTTRFVILSRSARPLDRPNKATVTFRLGHTVGALARVLDSFAQSGLNMTRIESRPQPETPFVYFFSADFEGDLTEYALRAAMAAARPFTTELRLAGFYRKGVLAEQALTSA